MMRQCEVLAPAGAASAIANAAIAPIKTAAERRPGLGCLSLRISISFRRPIRRLVCDGTARLRRRLPRNHAISGAAPIGGNHVACASDVLATRGWRRLDAEAGERA